MTHEPFVLCNPPCPLCHQEQIEQAVKEFQHVLDELDKAAAALDMAAAGIKDLKWLGIANELALETYEKAHEVRAFQSFLKLLASPVGKPGE